MGISVKSRSRTETTKDDYVSIPNDDFDKIENACAAFDAYRTLPSSWMRER